MRSSSSSSPPAYDDARPESADWEAVTVAGVFGTNASGKSNLLDALSFMRDTVRWSMNHGEPGSGIHREPFALDAEAATDPSIFVIDLMLSGVRHTYGFAIDDGQVTEEWLYTYPKRRKRVVFERDGEDFAFGLQDARERAERLPPGSDPSTEVHRLVRAILRD